MAKKAETYTYCGLTFPKVTPGPEDGVASVKVNVALEPWETPDFVELVDPGMVSKWHLWEMSAETLARQCDRFRAEVFEKAGLGDPAEVY